MSAREFEVIVYGATGFTGRLIAEYLNKEYSADLRWAMAARSGAKLKTVRSEMGISNDIALIEADAGDPASLAALAGRTQVVITAVGPYQKYGEPLVKACVEAGTDYVDLSGEPLWMKDMIEKYDVAARKRGARLVHS